MVFGIVFAFNSSVHSYLVLAYTEDDKVALNVGFYYMANAGGRLAGHRALWFNVSVLWAGGLFVGVTLFVLLAALITLKLPNPKTTRGTHSNNRRRLNDDGSSSQVPSKPVSRREGS